VITIEDRKNKQLLWYENEVYFSNSISAFFKSSFGTCSTGTVFQVYFYIKFGLETMQKPSK